MNSYVLIFLNINADYLICLIMGYTESLSMFIWITNSIKLIVKLPLGVFSMGR